MVDVIKTFSSIIIHIAFAISHHGFTINLRSVIVLVYCSVQSQCILHQLLRHVLTVTLLLVTVVQCVQKKVVKNVLLLLYYLLMDHFQPAIIVQVSLVFYAQVVTIFSVSAVSQTTSSLIIVANVSVIASNLRMEHVIYVTTPI